VIGNTLDTFKYVLVGSETARVSSTDGAAVCVGYNDANSDMHHNYFKPRYLADSSAFDDLVALKSLYRPDHYRCELPVFEPGSYKTRIRCPLLLMCTLSRTRRAPDTRPRCSAAAPMCTAAEHHLRPRRKTRPHALRNAAH
jgi:hypothetical protein